MISFDSLTLKKWVEDNKDFLTGAKIRKIQQPTRRELIFTVRNKGINKKLYININPTFHHICFMDKENEEKRLIEIPQKPPMFCMLLRKYLENSQIAKVNQPEFERILEFYIETYNEFSEKIYLCLAIEFMGKHSNIILYNYDTNIILGCAHNVGAEKSKERELAGSLPYVYPKRKVAQWYAVENSISSEAGDINHNIDNYYSECIFNDKIKKLKDNYKQIVTKKLKKDETTLKKMEYQISKENDSDRYRLYGNLIMANLYNNKDYISSINVFNYENNENITIKLDETLTLKENANKFFKLYNKGKTTVSKLSELSESLRWQIDYYNQVLFSIDIARNIDDLYSIIAELEPEKHSNIKKSSTEPQLMEIEGCKVFVGKNNKQNDMIVSKLSKDEDYWFHVKDCAGSHVLLKCNNPSDELIYECAKLAKEYSKAKLSSKASVIYTQRKFIKKPPKANLGYVIYKNEKEIVVKSLC